MQNFMQSLIWQHIKKSSPIKVRVHKGNIVVAGNHIPQSRQTLLYPLDLHAGGGVVVKQNQNIYTRIHSYWYLPVRQGISYLLKLLVCCATGHQKPMSVPHSHPSNDSGFKVAGQRQSG